VRGLVTVRERVLVEARQAYALTPGDTPSVPLHVPESEGIQITERMNSVGLECQVPWLLLP
jgi:hypothetical protein